VVLSPSILLGDGVSDAILARLGFVYVLTTYPGFYINLPIGAICAVLILIVHIPNHSVPTDETTMQILRTKFDFTGFAMFCPSIVMILLALQWGGVDYPWNSATVIGLFCGGGVLLIMFVYWERRVGANAMIPLAIIRIRQVWTACLTQLFLFVTVLVASFYYPVYFQSVKDASPFKSGVNLLPSILTMIPAAVSSGVLGKFFHMRARITSTNKQQFRSLGTIYRLPQPVQCFLLSVSVSRQRWVPILQLLRGPATRSW
jgi:hypothetical protein